MNKIDLAWFAYSSGYLVVAFLFLFLAKVLYNLLTSFNVNKQLTEKDNPAMGLHVCGFLLGMVLVLSSVFSGDSGEPTLAHFIEEIKEVALYGALGLVLLLLAGLINDKLILHSFDNRKEIIEKENKAVAALTGTTYISSGVIIAAAIYASVDIISVLIFYGVGQLILLIFMFIYQKMTAYDDLQELGEKQNLPVALSISGNLLAYSLILFKGIAVNPAFVEEWSLQERLINVAYYAVGGVILLYLARLVVDFMFLPKVKLHKELVEDQNLNAGLMEGTLALSMGVVLCICL